MRLRFMIDDIHAFVKKVNDDCVSAFSAQTAFFIIISLFPFVMFLLTMLQYVPLNQNEVLEIVDRALPAGIKSFMVSILEEVEAQAAGTIISVTAITALWSASRGFLSIIRGFNAVYGIKENRNIIKLRFFSAIYTLVFALILIATMVLLVFGNTLYIWIEQKLPFLNDLALLIISLRTAVLLGVLVFFFVVLYITIPNRRSHFIRELPGAVLTSAGWMGFSYLYSFYIENMSNFTRMYGSLTAIVLFMLWLYFCMFIMFLGAELNASLQEINWKKRFARWKKAS